MGRNQQVLSYFVFRFWLIFSIVAKDGNFWAIWISHVSVWSNIYCSTKTMQPRPQGYSAALPFSGDYSVQVTSFSEYRKRLPNLVKLSGYEESAVGCEPIRNGEIF